MTTHSRVALKRNSYAKEMTLPPVALKKAYPSG
jgi:hypothetical protein